MEVMDGMVVEEEELVQAQQLQDFKVEMVEME
jgi:hypothetical protein